MKSIETTFWKWIPIIYIFNTDKAWSHPTPDSEGKCEGKVNIQNLRRSNFSIQQNDVEKFHQVSFFTLQYSVFKIPDSGAKNPEFDPEQNSGKMLRNPEFPEPEVRTSLVPTEPSKKRIKNKGKCLIYANFFQLYQKHK